MTGPGDDEDNDESEEEFSYYDEDEDEPGTLSDDELFPDDKSNGDDEHDWPAGLDLRAPATS